MIDLFKELLPGILQKKNYILTEENEKEYKPYVVNMALSQHSDCVLYVNEINLYPHLDNKLQYDFYYHTLRTAKRPYQKWFKSSDSNDLLNVKEYFDCSSDKAKESMRILTRDQLDHIAEIVNKGGVVK